MGASATLEAGRPDFERILRVTPTRIAICGRMGQPAARAMGSWSFYVALRRPFRLTLGDSETAWHSLALIPPWTTHHVVTEDSDIAMLMIEPESVDFPRMVAQLLDTPHSRTRTERALREGFLRTAPNWRDIDEQYFGAPLPTPKLNRRLGKAIDFIVGSEGRATSVDECADHARLSSSRLMHLFDEQLGISFRRFRNWKRARGLLTKFGRIPRLVDVALDAGYSDATQFGQHVRSYYGYTPSVMFHGSRQFAVIETSTTHSASRPNSALHALGCTRRWLRDA